MKIVKIPYLENLNGQDAHSASLILDQKKNGYKIDKINWPVDFPSCPETSFQIARSNEALYIKFSVAEINIRALYLNDQEPVWEDSCVEFFCKKPNSDNYINFEFNCIGTCLATSRKGRNIDVVPISEMQMKQIERFSSLERKLYNPKEGITHWELTVKIPFSVLEVDVKQLPEYLTGNFYKCGDGTLTPHYVSWNPILTDKPDFHCPEYFGKLVL